MEHQGWSKKTKLQRLLEGEESAKKAIRANQDMRVHLEENLRRIREKIAEERKRTCTIRV